MSLIGEYDHNQPAGSFERTSQRGYGTREDLARVEEFFTWGRDVESIRATRSGVQNILCTEKTSWQWSTNRT